MTFTSNSGYHVTAIVACLFMAVQGSKEYLLASNYIAGTY